MQEYDMEDMRETDYKVEFNNIWKLWRETKEQYHETLALLEICVAALELAVEWLDDICDEQFGPYTSEEGVAAKTSILNAIALAKGE